MEGIPAEECYKKSRDEGCNVEVVWQDGDSSSAKAVKNHHPEGHIFKGGGHVGRAHYNQLKEATKKKVFSADIKKVQRYVPTSGKCEVRVRKAERWWWMPWGWRSDKCSYQSFLLPATV